MTYSLSAAITPQQLLSASSAPHTLDSILRRTRPPERPRSAISTSSSTDTASCAPACSARAAKYVRTFANRRTLCRRYICIADTPQKYLVAKRIVCETLIEGEWTAADIRLSRHPSYSQRGEMLSTYRSRRKEKLRRYESMVKVHLFDKTWHKRDDGDPPPTNFYLTYQKTFHDDKQIKRIIDKTLNLAPPEISNDFNYNIYYRYQRSIAAIACLR